jgi:hypothetical protein
VLIDTHKLWPLLIVIAAGAAFDTLHSGGAAASDPSSLPALATLALALLKWSAAVGGLLAAAHFGARHAIGGRVFSGTKWTVANLFRPRGGDGRAAQLDGGKPQRELADPVADPAAAAAAARAFVLSTSALLATLPSHLEPPTVTRYREGQQQRVHFDGRPAGDPSGLQEFLAAGGQRLVQVGVQMCLVCVHDPPGLLHARLLPGAS